MPGDQSRTLKVGDRVCWGVTTTDLGTVIGTSWSEVSISWDDGEASSVSHNDMARVERGLPPINCPRYRINSLSAAAHFANIFLRLMYSGSKGASAKLDRTMATC